MVSLANDLRVACQRVSRRVRFESNSELPPHQVSAMSNLRKGPLTPGELADIERVSAPSMTRTANCLVEQGLVARTDHPDDGRCKVLSLTEAGLSALDRVARARDDWMVKQIEDLSRDEQDLLARATQILNRVLSQ